MRSSPLTISHHILGVFNKPLDVSSGPQSRRPEIPTLAAYAVLFRVPRRQVMFDPPLTANTRICMMAIAMLVKGKTTERLVRKSTACMKISRIRTISSAQPSLPLRLYS